MGCAFFFSCFFLSPHFSHQPKRLSSLLRCCGWRSYWRRGSWLWDQRGEHVWI